MAQSLFSCSTAFFYFSSKVEVLILFFPLLSELFCGPPGQQSRQFCRFLFFFADYYEVWSSGRDQVILLYDKSHRSLCESFSRTGAGLCIYNLLVWSNWNFLHISQWITLPIQSCLALSFCANLLHSLIMWLIVSSLSPHSLHLLFCCV